MDNYGYQSYQGRGRGPRRGNFERGRSSFRGQWRGPRNVSQIRRDTKTEETANDAKDVELKNKPINTDTNEMKKNNPKKETPELDTPAVSFGSEVGEWIEKERTNVEVALSPDFEDDVINQHLKQLDYATTVLQYSDPKQREVIKRLYSGFSICNLAFRLLLTLPRSTKRLVADHLTALNMGEVPRNTPLMVEMLSHIGKHKNEAYGNVRIEGQLLQAKRRIVRAMVAVSGVPACEKDFSWQDQKGWENFPKEKYQNGIWDDPDSLSWLRKRALSDYQEARKKNYNLGEAFGMADGTDGMRNVPITWVSVPQFEMFDTDPRLGGPWKPGTADILALASALKPWNKIIRDRVMACVLIMYIDMRFFKTDDVAIVREYPDLDTDDFSQYASTTMGDILDYLGLPRLSKWLDDRDLFWNYGVIVDNYRAAGEPTVQQVFKTVPLIKDEFGDEAQMMTSTDGSPKVNPRVESAFKIKDANKIAAAGLFCYAKEVVFHVADYTIFKRVRRTIINEAIDKLCRKH